MKTFTKIQEFHNYAVQIDKYTEFMEALKREVINIPYGVLQELVSVDIMQEIGDRTTSNAVRVWYETVLESHRRALTNVLAAEYKEALRQVSIEFFSKYEQACILSLSRIGSHTESLFDTGFLEVFASQEEGGM